MLDANDTTYFNVNGMLIYDPVISGGSAGIAPTNYFVEYWRNVSDQRRFLAKRTILPRMIPCQLADWLCRVQICIMLSHSRLLGPHRAYSLTLY